MTERPSKSDLYEHYWRDHEALTKIGERYDVTGQTVKRWIQKAGIPYNSNHHHGAFVFNKIPKRRLYEMYWSDHLSFEEIGDRFGISRNTVLHRFNVLGIPYSPSHTQTAYVINMMTKHHLYKLHWGDGLSLKEISQKFDVSNSLVTRVYGDSSIPVFKYRGTDFTGESIPVCYEWPDDRDNHHQYDPLPDNPDGSKYLAETMLHEDKERLYELHWGYGCSLSHIAEMSERNDTTLAKHFHDHGIPVRSYSTHTKWEPHHGVPPMYEWPDDFEDDEDAVATDDYNGMQWRQHSTGDSSSGTVGNDSRKAADAGD